MADGKDKSTATPDFIPADSDFIPDSGEQAQKPSTWDRLTASYNPDIEQWAEKHPVLGPPARFLDAAGGAAMAFPQAVYNQVRHPVESLKSMGESLGAWTKPETWKGAPGVLPEALGGGVGNVAAGEAVGTVIPRVAGSLKSTREGIGNAIHDPETGTLTPKAEHISRAAGAGVGGLIGHETGGMGYPGAVAGGYLAPSLMDTLFPEGAERIGARNATKLESRMGEVEKARQKELGQWERLREQEAQARMRREAPKEAAPLGSPENPGWHAKLPVTMPEPPAIAHELGTPENPGWHSKIPSTMPRLPEPLLPEPELGSPQNPGWHSKIPSTMPHLGVEPIAPELGSPENPGWHSKLPTRMPQYRGRITGAAPEEEGIKGTSPRASGRLVLTPSEAQAAEQLQGVAKKRASEHGMQYAAGMRPAAGKVPRAPIPTETFEYPGPREKISLEEPSKESAFELARKRLREKAKQ